jgi:hypothetical protein
VGEGVAPKGAMIPVSNHWLEGADGEAELSPPAEGRCCEQSLAGGLFALVSRWRWAGGANEGATTIERKQKKNVTPPSDKMG